jgi:hypothetical protein
MGNVEFFNPNEVNSRCTFDFTTANIENASFLFDNDISTKLSSDLSPDGTLEKFQIEFTSTRPIDFLGVFGHNFKTGNAKYLDGSMVEQDFDPPITFVDCDEAHSAFYFEQVNAAGVVLNITHTCDGAEKSIGELRALNKFNELPRAKRFTPALNIEQNLKTKYDGGKEKIIDGIKFGGTLKFDDLDDDDIVILAELAQRGRPFYIYVTPASTDKLKLFFRKQDQYLVNMTNDVKPQLPQGLVDSITWQADLKVEEV